MAESESARLVNFTGSTGSSGPTNLKQLGIRACGTCVKAKVKCIPNLQNRKCQRCERLDKHCLPSGPSTRKRAPSSQVAQLERKLDSLVTLLTASKDDNKNQPQRDFSRSPSRSLGRFLEIHSPEGIPEADTWGQSAPPANPSFVPGSSSSQSSAFAPQPPAPSFDIGRQDEALLLLEFRTQMAPQFPFVVVPPDATSESLRRERPMLWRSIVVAASYHNPRRQIALGWKLMEEFSTRILLKAEKSLDLLQALLVHVAWYHYHSAVNPQAMNLLALAKSMATNLGYHRTRDFSSRSKLLIDGPDGLSTSHEAGGISPNATTLEEWRALAGCFYLTAITASACRKVDPLQYTSHLEASCKTLAELQEYESDRLIIHLVMIQNIVVKISNILNEPDGSPRSSTAPIKMYIKECSECDQYRQSHEAAAESVCPQALQLELDAFKQNLPNDIKQNPQLQLRRTWQIAEISLYEIGAYRAFNPENDTAHRLTLLYACLMAVKTFFDTHFSPSSPIPPSLCYMMWIQSGYALLMGIKLCCCIADGWDLDHVREVLQFLPSIDTVVSKLERIIQLRKPNEEYPIPPASDKSAPNDDIFSRYLRQMRCVKRWYLLMISSNKIPPSECSPETQQNQRQPPRPNPQNFLQPPTPDSTMELVEPIPEDFIMGVGDDFWQGFYDDAIGNNQWMDFGN